MLWGQKYISQPQQIHMQLWTNQILVDNKSYVIGVQKYISQPQQIHICGCGQIKSQLTTNPMAMYRNTFVVVNKSHVIATTNPYAIVDKSNLSLNKSICGSGQILQPFNTVFPITLYSTVQQATVVNLLLCTVQYSRLQ